jgi:hypothetical protein
MIYPYHLLEFYVHNISATLLSKQILVPFRSILKWGCLLLSERVMDSFGLSILRTKTVLQ